MKLAKKFNKIAKRKAMKANKETINYLLRMVELNAKDGKFRYTYLKQRSPSANWLYIEEYFSNKGFALTTSSDEFTIRW